MEAHCRTACLIHWSSIPVPSAAISRSSLSSASAWAASWALRVWETKREQKGLIVKITSRASSILWDQTRADTPPSASLSRQSIWTTSPARSHPSLPLPRLLPSFSSSSSFSLCRSPPRSVKKHPSDSQELQFLFTLSHQRAHWQISIGATTHHVNFYNSIRHLWSGASHKTTQGLIHTRDDAGRSSTREEDWT